MIGLADSVKRLRRRLGLAVVLVMLGASIAWAHSGLTMDGMPEAEVAAVCMAIMQTGVVALAVLALTKVRWPGPGAAPTALLSSQRTPRVRAPLARAGPATLQVFLR